MTANPPSSAGSGSHQSPDNFRVIRKRNRIPVSCGPCRHRKLKCNRQHPCENCVKRDDAASCKNSPLELPEVHCTKVEEGTSSSIVFLLKSGHVTHDPILPGNAGNYASIARNKRSSAAGDKASPDDMQARIDRLEGLVLSLMGSGAPDRRGSKDSKDDGDVDDDTGSQMHTEETTSEGTNEVEHDFNIKSEVDDDVEDVRSQLGFMKVEHGKSMYRGSSHWALVLSEIAEVRNYFSTAATREKFEVIAKEQERTKLQSVNTCFPFSASRSLSRTEILQYLPTQSVADKLVEHWFDAFDRSYHILHGPTFRKEYAAFWQDPTSPKIDLSWIGLLMAILATTMADLMNLGRLAKDPELMGMDSDQYKLPVEHCIILGLNANKPGLYTIQAMIIYLGWARSRTNNEQMWLYLGLILRVAQSMGLHRDSRKFEVDIPPYHVEMRRRLWNVLSCMDLLESIRIGLPSIVRAGESDAMLPSNIHDHEFDEDSKVLPPSRPMSEHTPMSYMIAKSKLASVFGRAVQMINMIRPAPQYDDILRLDAEARKVYSSMPDFLKFRPLEESRNDHPALIMQRYGLNILHQKSLLIMHRPYFAHRLKNNPRYAPSRRACLESAMTLLNHQYTSWDTQYNQKDKTLYHIDPISPSDFLPAAVIIMIEVWQASADLNSNGGIFTMGRGDHEHMLKVLERACHIYSTFPDNLEVLKAHAVLSHLIEKVKAKFYARRNEPSNTQSPPDNYSPFSSQPMSTTPEPSSAKDSEHSAAMTLGLLSSGGLTPLGSTSTFSAGFSSPPATTGLALAMDTSASKTGLTPLYQPASPGAVPFSFFSQGMGMGIDNQSSLGWDEWDNFIQGINTDPMNWNIPMSPPNSGLNSSETNSESVGTSPQWASMVAPDPGSN
ncbi:hypothetical protein H072_5207 [Dactylellina haptotyla CBS 200.50]|uniref:Zn(2)-C6 fungal-type domain-containing protein n=1 Tax=Dactylellina haptotyla (strain CBS 200.50) TaxID=1284197 RepID=S8ADA4_DACHA|nr:hypothetical protein H072_5207 [Dactylellina haptotyla CBS 200.50]